MRATYRHLLALITLASIVPATIAQPFLTLEARFLDGTTYGGAFWGDFNRDGQIDVLEVGKTRNAFGEPLLIARVRENRLHADSTLVDPAVAPFIFDVAATLNPVWLADAEWMDDNGDGYLDLLVTGTPDISPPYRPLTVLYRNVPSAPASGRFQPVGVALPPLYGGSIAWGDCDNDGDLDVHLTGVLANGRHFSGVYLNQGGDRFSSSGQLLDGRAFGDAAWADYDNDHDLDLVVMGVGDGGGYHTDLLTNEGDCRLMTTGASLPGLAFGAVDWGDVDSDGDQDLLLAGVRRTSLIGEAVSKVYRNDGGLFSDLQGNLDVPLFFGSARFGDHDNDGLLDAILSGHESIFADSLAATQLYNNDSGGLERFTNDCSPSLATCRPIPRAAYGSATFVDLDDDDDLDLLVAGADSRGGTVTRLFRNQVHNRGRPDIPLDEFPDPLNYPPRVVSGLSSSVSGTKVLLSWSTGRDSLLAPPAGWTPPEGLTYNLRVGTTPGAGDVMPPLSQGSGKRLVVRGGNVGSNRSWELRALGPGRYYWSVQAVDNSFSGSIFAPEQTFEIQ